MLLLSDFTITLNKSPDYCRLTFLIYLLAWIMVCCSSLHIRLIIVISILLIVGCLDTIRCGRPLLKYSKLCYQSKRWILYEITGGMSQFEGVCVRFDGGLFFLIELLAGKQRKTLALFKDQLSSDQFRLLKLVERTQSNL